MITIKCGTCGTSQGYKTKADGILSLPTSEEARLVARGVAEYVTRPVIGVETAAATAQSGQAGDGASRAPMKETGNANPTVEELMGTMTRKQLEAMAKDMGLDVSKCSSKEDVAILIASVEADTEDDDETPPQVAPEDPV